MKRYIFSLLVGSVTLSQAMTWVDQKDNKLTKEATKALKILGVEVSDNIEKAYEILRKHYTISADNIKKGIVVKTEEGKEISAKTLKKFLNYVDKHVKELTIEKGSLSKEAVAIVPTSTVLKVNKHIFNLLKKHAGSFARIVIFAQDEKSKAEIQELIAKNYSSFKNIEYIVASNAKDVVKDCSEQLKKEWEKAKFAPEYAIFTHLKEANDSIKESLAGNYKGSAFKALPWKKSKKLFGEKTANVQALSQLRDLTTTVAEHVKKMHKKA